jgi:hypothetical protein
MPISITKTLFYLLLFGMVTWACINPIKDFMQVDSTSFTTIEADISDDAELSKVRLTSSSNQLTSQLAIPISKAVVSITDQNGLKTSFTEGIPLGTYYPPKGFAGKVGSTYKLNVKMLSGQTYESAQETMKAVPEIENTISRFEIFDQYSKVDSRRAGFTVYLDFKDLPSEGDYYLWNWKHYEQLNYCATCTDGAKYDFNRLDCVVPRNPTSEILNYLCDGKCWSITTNNDLNVFSDALTNGQRVVGRQVARVPFDNTTPYYFRLEQRSITKNAFAFYQSLIAQVQSSGSLFDVPAETRFSLNIKSLTNPTERVLGIFNVFSIRKKIFLIDRKQNIPINEYPMIPPAIGLLYSCPPGATAFGCKDQVPCMESATRTKITPEGWVF